MRILNIINWKVISFFGKSAVINRSYIYLFLVPALAKVLSKINSPIHFLLGNTKYQLVLELPFSWKLFFFSALFFSIGALLYNLFAPAIIKENESFGDFLNHKKNFTHVFSYRDNIGLTNQWVQKVGVKLADLNTYGDIPVHLKNFKKYRMTFLNNQAIEKFEMYNYIYKASRNYNETNISYLENAFWKLYSLANKSHPIMLFMTTVFYLIGFILISIVFIQSILLVLNIN